MGEGAVVAAGAVVLATSIRTSSSAAFRRGDIGERTQDLDYELQFPPQLVSRARERALFVNEGDSVGTRGQGRFEQIIRRHAPEAGGVTAAFLRLHPMLGLTAARRLRSRRPAVASRPRLPDREVARDPGPEGARGAASGSLRRARRTSSTSTRTRPRLRSATEPDSRRSCSPPTLRSGTGVRWGSGRRAAVVTAGDEDEPHRSAARTGSGRCRRRLDRLDRPALRTAAPGAHIVVQHPGLDLQHFRPAKHSSREVPRILFVGARFARKGGVDLIDAIRPLLAGGQAELDIVSPDDVPTGPGIRVHRLTGTDPRLLGLFQQADCFCSCRRTAMPRRGSSSRRWPAASR